MEATNKNALTVTYGSFSVTLEGQENPFDLLRDVTDYYRKVAMENPHFGAIPSATTVAAPRQNPTPTPATAQEKFQQAVVNKTNKQTPPTHRATPEASNLWDEDAQSTLEPPLILKSPVTPSENTDHAQIEAARQALPHPDEITQPQVELKAENTSVIKPRFPFRRFPVRAPRDV